MTVLSDRAYRAERANALITVISRLGHGAFRSGGVTASLRVTRRGVLWSDQHDVLWRYNPDGMHALGQPSPAPRHVAGQLCSYVFDGYELKAWPFYHLGYPQNDADLVVLAAWRLGILMSWCPPEFVSREERRAAENGDWPWTVARVLAMVGVTA